MANNQSWEKIFADYKILEHDFDSNPFEISASEIKISCEDFKSVAQKEVRILCKQDTRESRPQIFKENNLFLLPTKNGFYSIIKGEGYIEIPEIDSGHQKPDNTVKCGKHRHCLSLGGKARCHEEPPLAELAGAAALVAVGAGRGRSGSARADFACIAAAPVVAGIVFVFGSSAVRLDLVSLVAPTL